MVMPVHHRGQIITDRYDCTYATPRTAFAAPKWHLSTKRPCRRRERRLWAVFVDVRRLLGGQKAARRAERLRWHVCVVAHRTFFGGVDSPARSRPCRDVGSERQRQWGAATDAARNCLGFSIPETALPWACERSSGEVGVGAVYRSRSGRQMRALATGSASVDATVRYGAFPDPGDSRRALKPEKIAPYDAGSERRPDPGDSRRALKPDCAAVLVDKGWAP